MLEWPVDLTTSAPEQKKSHGQCRTLPLLHHHCRVSHSVSRKKNIESSSEHRKLNIKAKVSIHCQAQCHTKGSSGCWDFEHPVGLKPKLSTTLPFHLTTKLTDLYSPHQNNVIGIIKTGQLELILCVLDFIFRLLKSNIAVRQNTPKFLAQLAAQIWFTYYGNEHRLLLIFSLTIDQFWAWTLEKPLMRPLFFLYFGEIRPGNKGIHWPGSQSAHRLYNLYNLCPCARPSHVGKFWRPGSEFKFSKTVKVRWLCSDLQLCQREIATDKIQEKKIIESAAV